jgi:hypothetical protein
MYDMVLVVRYCLGTNYKGFGVVIALGYLVGMFHRLCSGVPPGERRSAEKHKDGQD